MRYIIELIDPIKPSIMSEKAIKKTASKSSNTNRKIMIKIPAKVNFRILENSLITIFHVFDLETFVFNSR